MGYDFTGFNGFTSGGAARVYVSKKTNDFIKGQEAARATVANFPEAAKAVEDKIAFYQAAVDDMTVEANDVLELLQKNNIKIIAPDKDGNATGRTASIAITALEEQYTDKEGNKQVAQRQQYAINGYNGSLVFRCGEYKDKDDKGEFTAYGSTNVTFQKFNGKGQPPFTCKNQDILTSDKVPAEFKDAVKAITDAGYVRFFSYDQSSAFIWNLRKQLAENVAKYTSKVSVEETVVKTDENGNKVLDNDGKEIIEKTGKMVEKDAEYVSVREFKTADGVDNYSILLCSRETPSQQVQISAGANGGLFINVVNFDKLVDKDGNVSDRPEGSTDTNFYRPLIKKPEEASQYIQNKVLAKVVEEFKTDLDKAREAAKNKGKDDKGNA